MPLRVCNITSLENMRNLFVKSNFVGNIETLNAPDLPKLDIVIDDFYATGKKTIFVIGKGGVKKASFVSVITIGLSPPPQKKRGGRRYLTTADPAAHLKFTYIVIAP